ncbi:MAG: hypothetical protein ABJN22_08110 [Litorimonas sp.]
MRKILLATLFSAIAIPAFATDSGDAAFELLSKYSTEKQRPNFIKLQSSLDMADAREIDAKISEIYGSPEVSRSGLKVWEMENTSGKGGKRTTIMCGPDGKGGILISVDRRGKARKKAAKGQEKKKFRQANAAKTRHSNSNTTSDERD